MDNEEEAMAKDILGRLSDSDLEGLKDTVTNKQISAYRRKDCISAIVSFSQSAKELLSRKRIKRDILIQYLYDNHITVSANASKETCVNSVIKFWKSKSQHKNQDAGTATPTKPEQQVSADHQLYQSNPEGRQPHAAVSPINVSITVNVQATSQPTSSEQVGEAFVTWFYKMLNSQNPTLSNVPEDFGSHHFWPDVNFKLLCVTPQPLEEEFTGADLTTQRLLALVKEEQLLFNPNISTEGMMVKANPHGQLVLIVCGTVHRGQDCLGEFEQLFGLLRDPRFDNNWKVKITKLRITCSQVTAMPKLTAQAVGEVTALIPV